MEARPDKILGEIDEVLDEGRLAELDAVISEVFSGGNGCRCYTVDAERMLISDVHALCQGIHEESVDTDMPPLGGCGSNEARWELGIFRSWHSHPASSIQAKARSGFETHGRGENELINRFIVACNEAVRRHETPPRWDAWLYLEEEGTEGLQP